MSTTPQLLPELLQAISRSLAEQAEEITALDQAIGDGDHLINLQRGLHVLTSQIAELALLDWKQTFQKIGMSLLSNVGGASGSLYGTLFIAMSKATPDNAALNLTSFAAIFAEGVEAMKKRGKSDAGEKTMLDVLIPVAEQLKTSAVNAEALSDVLPAVAHTAIAGMESTRYMLATKGRASFLEERSRGYLDAGAKTAQLMICAVIEILRSNKTS